MFPQPVVHRGSQRAFAGNLRSCSFKQGASLSHILKFPLLSNLSVYLPGNTDWYNLSGKQFGNMHQEP